MVELRTLRIERGTTKYTYLSVRKKPVRPESNSGKLIKNPNRRD